MNKNSVFDNWQLRPKTILGNYCEKLIATELEEKGWTIGIPSNHRDYDRFAIKDNKTILFDVKCKKRMYKEPITGIDSHFYKKYKQLSKESNNPFYIFYVDYFEKEIYYQSLATTGKENWAEKEIDCWEEDWQKYIPHTFWDIKNMKIVRELNKEEIEYIKGFDDKKFEYKYNLLTYTNKRR